MLNEKINDRVKKSFKEDLKYKPDHLLNVLREKMDLDSDAELARFLEVEPPLLSRIRNQKKPIGPTMLIYMHERSGLSIRDLKQLAGMV